MGIRYLIRKLRASYIQSRNYSSQGFNVDNRRPAMTAKLDTPEFHALFTPERKELINAYQKYNYDLRIVGGAVRDLLIRRKPTDIDFASIATPDQMKSMFKQENIRVLYNYVGENHGTVTVRINNKEDFQITTLRTDQTTDGRFAKVEFTTDWYLDACRRDFTMNSLYLGLDGTVYDYFGGIKDLENKRVQFIGHPETRIKEDYLRILRYFRFYGRIATDPNNLDTEILEIIKRHINGLSGIYGIKLWTELNKILLGNLNFHLMKKMLSLGIAPHIGLPVDVSLNEFERLSRLSTDFIFDPMTIIASLVENKEQILAFNERVKLRKHERELGIFIVNHRDTTPSQGSLEPYLKMMVFAQENKLELRHRIEQLLSYSGDANSLKKFQTWEVPVFPVRNQQILDRGIEFGHKFKRIHRTMLERWFYSSFTLTAQDLLTKFDDIVQESTKKSKKKKSKEKENIAV